MLRTAASLATVMLVVVSVATASADCRVAAADYEHVELFFRGPHLRG